MSADDSGGRFASLSKEDIDTILDNADSVNTKRSTSTAVKLFRQYLTAKQKDTDFEQYALDELDSTLSTFYMEMRDKKGQLYKKSTLLAYRGGIQRHLERTREDINLAKVPRSGSFSAKMKRKLVVAVSKMSSTFSSGERRLSLQEDKIATTSNSPDAMLGYLVPPIAISPRHSADLFKGQMSDINNSARSYTGSETGASINDNNSDFDEKSKRLGSTSPDRPAPDGDDITSMLGPAQVPPKPASEQSVCGDVRLGLMVTQGKLEIDIICVTGLLRDSENAPPDTYVKTYLVEGSKVIQKKKTATVKASYEPTFHRKIKYSACNIHGRHIKVKIWARQGAFDKKLCLGETVIRLDGLDLSQHTHTLSWYKFFPQGATDFISNESLSF